MHSRSKRPPLHDATLALLFERCHWDDVVAIDSLLFGAEESPTKSSRPSIAVTTKHSLAEEVRDTELLFQQHQSGSNAATSHQKMNLEEEQSWGIMDEVCCVPALHDLEELMNELYEVYDRCQDEELSTLENEYAQTLLQAVAVTLTQAALVKQHGSNNCTKQDPKEPLPLGEVRVWLLEMVVRPSALSRQLAFTLFLNLSISTTSILLATEDGGVRQAEQMQSRLFRVLMEMLSKAVVVAASSVKSSPPTDQSQSSRACWIEQAVGCFLLFTKHGARYRADRLSAVDPQIIRFLLKETCDAEKNSAAHNSELENQLVELLIFTMYAQECDVAAGTTKSQHRFSLPMAAVDRFGGLDLLLFYFYNSHSQQTKRLLLLVFFDVNCEHARNSAETTSTTGSNQGGYDQLWRYFVKWDLAAHLTSTPCLFTASSTTRTMKKLYASASTELMLSEKQVQHFFNQLRILIHVDEYYAQSSVLANTIQLLRDQEQHNIAEVLMAKVAQLIGSSRVEDRFHGERWLAELVAYDTNGGGFSSSSSSSSNNLSFLTKHTTSPKDQLSESIIFSGTDDVDSSMAAPNQDHGDELEETCCFDEGANIRIAAGNAFWELARSSSPSQRESFARILSVFVKRKLRSKQRETNPRVLVSLLFTILDVCKREVSYQDRQKQRYDRDCASEVDTNRLLPSDSLASRFVEGTVALDRALLREFIPEFFVHALSVLHVQAHPPQQCRQRCCGKVASSLVADVITCVALIIAEVPEVRANPSAKSDDAIAALIPLMGSCDTRVAVIMAKRIISTLKHSNMEAYVDILRDLHAVAVEDDDEAPLASSYLHATALLAKWEDIR